MADIENVDLSTPDAPHQVEVRPAVFPVLISQIPAITPLWAASDHTFMQYISEQDSAIKKVYDQQLPIQIRAVDPERYLLWCINQGLDQCDTQVLATYTGPCVATYDYGGSLWDIIMLQVVAVDLSKALADNPERLGSALDTLDQQVVDLLCRVVLHAAGEDGSAVLVADRGPGAPTNSIATGTTVSCSIDLVEGSWATDIPSRPPLLRAMLLLAQIWGGSLDLHLYSTENPATARSTTFWLPWGNGKPRPALKTPSQ